jgi:hypothetical protein
MVIDSGRTGSAMTHEGGQGGQRPSVGLSRHAIRLAALLAVLLGFSSTAHATPLIPFDGPEFGGFNYGFDNPTNYGITEFREMDVYYQAASPGSPPADTSLLLINPISFERCASPTANCNSGFHVFDIVWDVTFNANILGNSEASHEVDLIFVDSDPDSRFNNLVVTLDYSSAVLEGVNANFETANYRNGAFHFVDLALGAMVNGQTKRVGFTYQIEGELPISALDGAFVFPVILPAASIYNPVPEPGTATLLGLGIAALARYRKRN